MLFILTNFERTKITISMWKLWTRSSTHPLITSATLADYADMVNKQFNIYGELMYTENCLIVNIMKLKTPLCFHVYIILSTSSISSFIYKVHVPHYTKTYICQLHDLYISYASCNPS